MGKLQKIVLVDDEKSIQLLIKMALEKIGGLEVVAYDSGKDALYQIEEDYPDLILLDVMMPEMDGPEVFLKIRQLSALQHIPVFFLTGKSEDEEKSKLLELGVQGVIGKPFDPLQLSDHIKHMYEQLCIL